LIKVIHKAATALSSPQGHTSPLQAPPVALVDVAPGSAVPAPNRTAFGLAADSDRALLEQLEDDKKTIMDLLPWIKDDVKVAAKVAEVETPASQIRELKQKIRAGCGPRF
jgi:hypothetical protein